MMSDLEYLDKVLLGWQVSPHASITVIDLHYLITQAILMRDQHSIQEQNKEDES